MVENLRKSLRDSAAARWSALLIVSFTMMCGYFLTDIMAPLAGLLEGQLGWSRAEYGTFTSAYGWFNVFLLMLILGGIILDKLGVRITGVGAAAVMVIGSAIKYWAISSDVLRGQTLFGLDAQVFWASIGFAVFAVGVEVAGITVSKIIVKWFKGKELATAMGMQVAMARIGTALALGFSIPIAKATGVIDVSRPLLIALIGLCIGLIAFFMYVVMDRKLDTSEAAGAEEETNPEDEFKLSDIGKILGNKGWWYIAILCVLFYSAVFPFLKYATDLMVNKFGVEEDLAGLIPMLLPFGNILLTPLFGGIYDKIGKGATIMIIGASLLIIVHALFSIPGLNSWIFAMVLVVFLGIAFSLVPSAMWPSVPKIVPEKRLGTAYSLIFWVQNWGLMGVPLLIGWVLEKYCVTGQTVRNGLTVNTYDYTIPMLIFTSFGVLALVFAFLLKAEDKKKGYGLELPNMQK
ncbi:MAG: Aminoacyl-histidine dipeptidase [Proteiniphilum acetatigenes]|uniref:Lysosomal dipeptide transporter MFSD1 n=1 Tax=Proteiniphilum acetatigenes TaxID=294710 RepID=A0A101HKY4_9BACT|nr:MAG: Aminoacyl-histidine dipeptidase [Proteiniphilum acetatigenes]KUL20084.1 MAG: Aminoacyl-histidine dipeptidase [Proteiniphilum sp. 51_7]HCC85825.1 oxalate:formate antiporter [Porphyromonadaceae bacterium]